MIGCYPSGSEEGRWPWSPSWRQTPVQRNQILSGRGIAVISSRPMNRNQRPAFDVGGRDPGIGYRLGIESSTGNCKYSLRGLAAQQALHVLLLLAVVAIWALLEQLGRLRRTLGGDKDFDHRVYAAGAVVHIA
jgi:hypothetical protein